MPDAAAVASSRGNHPRFVRKPGRHRRFGVSANLAREKKPPPKPVESKAAPVETPEKAEPTITVPGRVLAIFSDYAGLQAAVRSRIAALRITHETLDYLSGNQEGYTSKLMTTPIPMKRFGRVSLGNTLGGVGCWLALIESNPAPEEIAAENPSAYVMAKLDTTLSQIGCAMALVEDVAATEKIMKRAKTRRRPLHQMKMLPPPSAAHG